MEGFVTILAMIQVFAAVRISVPIHTQRTIQIKCNLMTQHADQFHPFSLTIARLSMVLPDLIQMDCADWDAPLTSNAEFRGYPEMAEKAATLQ